MTVRLSVSASVSNLRSLTPGYYVSSAIAVAYGASVMTSVPSHEMDRAGCTPLASSMTL